MILKCDVRLSVSPNITTLNITNYSPPNAALPSHKTLINNTAVRNSKLARSYQYYCDNCRGIFRLFQNRRATYHVQCEIWYSQSSTAWDTHPLGCKDHVDGSIANWFVVKITVTLSSRSTVQEKCLFLKMKALWSFKTLTIYKSMGHINQTDFDLWMMYKLSQLCLFPF